jgi:hypothetical protein
VLAQEGSLTGDLDGIDLPTTEVDPALLAASVEDVEAAGGGGVRELAQHLREGRRYEVALEHALPPSFCSAVPMGFGR